MKMPNKIRQELFHFTAEMSKQIQDINGDPSLTALEKKAAIGKLNGAPREAMLDYLKKNFRTEKGLQ